MVDDNLKPVLLVAGPHAACFRQRRAPAGPGMAAAAEAAAASRRRRIGAVDGAAAAQAGRGCC
jgi:hypothetical protein